MGRAGRAWAVALTLGVLAVGLLWVSGREGATATSSATNASGPRLVSLSPAITQWITELGHADALVAVGDGDAFAPRGLPSVGTFFDVDLERLAGVRPTAVLSATARDKLPPALRAAAARDGFALDAWPFPRTLDEATAFGRRVGAALDDAERGAAASVALRKRLDAVASAVAGRPRVRALMLFSLEPMRACGAGTVHHELLRLAGGENVLDQAAGPAPVLDRELLRGLAPDVVLLMRPGVSPREASDSFTSDTARVVRLSDPAVLLPGPTMDTTAVSFAVALHPERARAVAEAYAEASGLPRAEQP